MSGSLYLDIDIWTVQYCKNNFARSIEFTKIKTRNICLCQFEESYTECTTYHCDDIC